MGDLMTNEEVKHTTHHYHEAIQTYPSETISACFSKLSPEHQLAVMMSATDILTECLLSKFELQAFFELSDRLITTANPSSEALENEAYNELISLLQNQDTHHTLQKKQTVLLNMYHSIIDSALQKKYLEHLESSHPEYAKRIRDLIIDQWTFENSDDRSIQRLMREIDSIELAIFLENSSKTVQQRFFNNMSSRLCEMIKEDMAYYKNSQATTIRHAIQSISNTYMKLSEAGEVDLPRRD